MWLRGLAPAPRSGVAKASGFCLPLSILLYAQAAIQPATLLFCQSFGVRRLIRLEVSQRPPPIFCTSL